VQSGALTSAHRITGCLYGRVRLRPLMGVDHGPAAESAGLWGDAVGNVGEA